MREFNFKENLSHPDDQKAIETINAYLQSGLLTKKEHEKQLTRVALTRAHLKQRQNTQKLMTSMWQDLYEEQEKDFARMGLL